MNCDRIAPFYRFFEKAAFGGRLQTHRLVYVAAAEGKRRALILGDGDGRFTQALAASYPQLEIDSVELSARMAREAQRRVPGKSHVRIWQGDAFQFSFAGTYDIVFTHFFLDCFNSEKVGELVSRLSEFLTPGAGWVISDFRQATTGWRKVYTRIWLSVMYRFFRLASGLETQTLPPYGAVLAAAGFRKQCERVSADGLIGSEQWQR